MRAVYAGSFDPFHKGHLSVLNQAKELFLVDILVMQNPSKKEFYPIETRLDIIKRSITKANVFTWNGFVADYCKKEKIKYLIRGLRSTSDYLYEEQIALVNEKLYPGLKTVYFRADHNHISSSLIREMIRLGKEDDIQKL